MAAISTSLKTAATNNLNTILKGHQSNIERHHYSGPSGYHQYEHYQHKTKHKRSVAISALTLLAFLFFLNILQNCIQDQMNQMQTTPNIIVVTTPAPTAAYINRYREAQDEDFSNVSRSDKNVDKLIKYEKISNGHRNNKKLRGNV